MALALVQIYRLRLNWCNTSVGNTWAIDIFLGLGLWCMKLSYLRFYLRLVKELVYELRLLGCKINVPTLEVGQELPSLH